MHAARVGPAVFASTLIVLGAWGLVEGDFAAIWQPVPKSLPARDVLAYACAVIAMATGAGLLWRRTAAPAARVLLAWLLLWLLLVKGRVIWLAPADAAAWESGGETAVLLAAAWVLYAGSAAGLATGEAGLRVARAVYALALIAFGVAHLAYVKETAALVPGWLPSPEGWVYFTGGTYIAAGVAMLAGMLARLAAVLAAVQIGLFTLLVWVPPLAAGSKDASQWSEAVISWMLTAGAWVLAESFRGVPWLARGGR